MRERLRHPRAAGDSGSFFDRLLASDGAVSDAFCFTVGREAFFEPFGVLTSCFSWVFAHGAAGDSPFRIALAYSCSCAAVGLSQVSFAMQAARVSFRVCEKSPLMTGTSAPWSCMTPPCPMNGSSPVIISYRDAPRAHTSVAFTASGFEENSSGAM